ncbi:hypothetical protein [Nonomuraea sp. NPDC046570]|uniref:hypothetical protein n=1 Tax=Nonomuraea sp. NPDC046570 TaxID=3155255 RepID=UPI00340B3608
MLAEESATCIIKPETPQARAIGNEWLGTSLPLPNYANNLLRLGFTEQGLSSKATVSSTPSSPGTTKPTSSAG